MQKFFPKVSNKLADLIKNSTLVLGTDNPDFLRIKTKYRITEKDWQCLAWDDANPNFFRVRPIKEEEELKDFNQYLLDKL